MNNRSFVKNIFYLEVISIVITIFAFVLVVNNEYDNIVSNSSAKINALERPLLDSVELGQYNKIQSLLYVIKEPETDGVVMSIVSSNQKRNIHAGKIYPANKEPMTYLKYRLLENSDESVDVCVYGEWKNIVISVFKKVSPVLIGVNILVVVIILCAQLPFLLHSRRLILLLNAMSLYDGSCNGRERLRKLSSEVNDAQIYSLTTHISNILDREKELSALEQENEKIIALGKIASHLAHDMRTPLSVFKNLVEVLQEDRLTKEEIGELTESAARSMAKLNNMAEDLLDYSKAQQVVRTNVAVDDAVKEVLSEVAAEAKALNVTVSYKKDVGIYASVDAGKLNRVLANMIINAIQAHEKPGHVMVEAIIDGENLAFVISDSGKGIPEDKMERIFDRSFTFGKPKGTGLGLAYCKQVVEAHGGKIEVQSKPGEGSQFTVRLPACVAGKVEAGRQQITSENIRISRDPSPSTRPRPAQVEANVPTAKGACETETIFPKKAGNILIADDDFGIRLQWIKIVQRLGGTIVCAVSSPDELMQAGGFDYAAVDTAIVDYQYEGHEKTGIDLIAHLKKNGVEKIHLCTGHFGDTDVQKRAAEAGAMSVLAKPIDESEAEKALC